MTIYKPGQRVALVHTDDPQTLLCSGDTGTVRRHNRDLNTVDVDWDTGSRLSMCLDAGDRLQPLHDTLPAPSIDSDQWETTLAALRAAGADAGHSAADWWAQDTIGGRATGDVRATARKILTGIDDGDPEVLDTLPSLDLSGQWADSASDADRYHAATGNDALPWATLDDDRREDAIEAYRDAHDTAVLDRVTDLCHLAASPTGRDLSHLHPDQVRVGHVGVFSGNWAWTTGADESDCIPVGFIGTLIDRWNGWAVFSCTRQVAEAIVADQQRMRIELGESLAARGVPPRNRDHGVNTELTNLYFDGDDIVADQRAQYRDPQAIERVQPDTDGRYVVMGWNWCWEAVDPYACDRIIGDLPEVGREQDFELLAHTPGLRVPHTRLHLTDVRYQPDSAGLAFTATLALDGQPLATVTDGGAGHLTLDPDDPAATHDGLRTYLAACRFQGRPVSLPRLVQALADEHLLGRAVRQAAADGGTQLRLVDDAGHTRALRPIAPAPAGLAELLELCRTLTHDPDQQWQIWTGASWFAVPGTLTGSH